MRNKKIQKVYNLSVELYYEVADDTMYRRAHPGVMGPASDEKFNPDYGTLMGAIETLRQVAEKIKNQNENAENKVG